MSKLGVFPISVLMARQRLQNRWIDECWHARAVLAAIAMDPASERSAPAADAIDAIDATDDVNDGAIDDEYVVGGLELELFPDEDDGYFENWAAPEPKVFVLWRMEGDRAVPVRASVSYAEGARMMDSGEAVDGVSMPREIYAWLGEYLRMHYRPPTRRGRH